MVAPKLEQNYMQAAHEFSNVLERLGFDMEAVFWGYDDNEERHILIIVTDVFDAQGPLEISKQIFRAYNASLTPKEIDPFVVVLFSPRQTFAVKCLTMINNEWTFCRNFDERPSSYAMVNEHVRSVSASISQVDSEGIMVKPEWVVMSRGMHKTRKTVEINRRWHSFKRHIDEKIAA